MKTLAWSTLVCVLAASPALAHHSFAMFDFKKETTVTGVVKEFQWTNPHIWLQVDVPNAKGVPEEWGIEGSSPGALSRAGWSRHAFQPGDKIILVVHPMMSGEHGGSFMKATFADGHVIENHGLGGTGFKGEAQ